MALLIQRGQPAAAPDWHMPTRKHSEWSLELSCLHKHGLLPGCGLAVDLLHRIANHIIPRVTSLHEYVDDM
eukprot:2881563-Amphidinium_carterae.1